MKMSERKGRRGGKSEQEGKEEAVEPDLVE